MSLQELCLNIAKDQPEEDVIKTYIATNLKKIANTFQVTKTTVLNCHNFGAIYFLKLIV